MSSARHARTLEDIARDLDMVVYRLEREIPDDPVKVQDERKRTRRELDRLREAIEDVARDLG